MAILVGGALAALVAIVCDNGLLGRAANTFRHDRDDSSGTPNHPVLSDLMKRKNAFQYGFDALMLCRQSRGRVPMRIPALAILTTASVLMAAPTQAQTYDPDYPVCLNVITRGASFYECRYTSLPQCNMSASGRGGQCIINPYFAGGQHHRRHRRVY